MFQALFPFFANNNSLSELEVAECDFGAGCIRQLSLMLRGCSNSLKSVELHCNFFGGDVIEGAHLATIIEGLGVHSQLEKLGLNDMNAGRHECRALSDLFHSTFTQLETLDLSYMGIDDEGVSVLVGGLANSNLCVLDLSKNQITARGCERLAPLLANPNSNLEQLFLYNNNIGNEGAIIFANALTTNNKLKRLNLIDNGITAEGWSSFSKVLCDTSSINKTHNSNHTLENLALIREGMPADVQTSLALNASSGDKKEVAMKKIMTYHQHFDMQPFFEWDLKVLPIAISWFERAQFIQNVDQTGIGKHKLGAIYQFIRAMPDAIEQLTPAAGGETRNRSAASDEETECDAMF